jgi:hypothetical protein
MSNILPSIPSFSLPNLPTSLQALAAPTSQKYKTIGFTVDNLATMATPQTFNLPIRPEALSRQSTSRITVQQTLGGTGWADDFGPGLDVINIQGTTGWRGTAGNDGAALFQQLYAMIYTNWHQARNQLRGQGQDPNQIELIFTDTLDNIIEVVAPLTFTLQRSKSSPLLSRYSIQLIVLGDQPPPAPASWLAGILSSIENSIPGLPSLIAAVSSIFASAVSAIGWAQANILGPLQAYMNMAGTLFNQVVGLMSLPGQALTYVQQLGAEIAYAGMQTASVIGSTPGNNANQIAGAMIAGAAFSDIFCLMSNNPVAQAAQSFPDYTALYGGSNCSTTVPGSSPASQYTLSGANPWVDVVGAQDAAPPVAVTVPAQQAINLLNGTDMVLSPMSLSALASLLETIANGVTPNAA